jgi:hypothetical protein
MYDCGLTRAYLRDLVTEIRCARQDARPDNDLADYAERRAYELRVLWRVRHAAPIDRYGTPLAD